MTSSTAIVLYDDGNGDSSSWRACCNLLSSQEAEPDNPKWFQSVEKLLELNSPNLPFGRSWLERINNFTSEEERQECISMFSNALVCATANLAKALFRLKQQQSEPQSSANLIQCCAMVVDSTKPLYFYRSSVFASHHANRNEGFEQLHERVLGVFLSETENLSVLSSLLNSDLVNNSRIIKLALQICSEYGPTAARPQLFDMHSLALVCCKHFSQAMPFSGNKTLAEDLCKDLFRLGEFKSTGDDPGPPVRAWKDMAVRWFRSDKLTLKRQGLEQLGLVCRFLVHDMKLAKQDVTMFLKQDMVLEHLLAPSAVVDERLLPCLEDILVNVDIDEDMIEVLLQRSGSLAVQRLLGNIASQYAFPAETAILLLDGAIRKIAARGEGQHCVGAISLIKAALVDSKQTRTALLRKGKECAASVVSALLIAVLAEGEDSTVEALYQTLQEVETRAMRRFSVDYLVICAFNLEGAPQQGEAWWLYCNQGGNKLAALRALRRVLSSFSLQYNSFTTECNRTELLTSLESDFSIKELLLREDKENTTNAEVFSANLELFSFFKRFVGKPDYGIQIHELEQLYRVVRTSTEHLKVFASWLTTCSCAQSSPCLFDENVYEFALTGLFSNHDLITGGEHMYKLIQTLFVAVNKLPCEQENDVGSQQFKLSQPPLEFRGAKLVGSKVSVLHQDGTMHHGLVTAFKDWGRHTFEYYSGTVEEKAIEDLNEWWLLPSEPRAGRVIFPSSSVELQQEYLLGVEQVWILALESEMDTVALRASQLLFALYACNGNTTSFVHSVFRHLNVVHGETALKRCLDLLDNMDHNHQQANGTAVVLFALLANEESTLELKLRVWDILQSSSSSHINKRDLEDCAASYWRNLYEKLDYDAHTLEEVGIALYYSDSQLAPHLAYSVDFTKLHSTSTNTEWITALLLQMAALRSQNAPGKFLAPSLQLLSVLLRETGLGLEFDMKFCWEMLVVHKEKQVRESTARLLTEHGYVAKPAILLDCLSKLMSLDEDDVPQCDEFFQLLFQAAASANSTTWPTFEHVFGLVLRKREQQPTILAGLVSLLALLPRTDTTQDAVYAQKLMDAFFLQINTHPSQVTRAVAALLRHLQQPTVIISALDFALQQFSSIIDSPHISRGKHKVGLVNRGSTCYLNSVLQLLFSVELFRDQILSAKLSNKPQEDVSLPPPAPTPPVILAWRCWCSGVNDISCHSCEICGTERMPDFELLQSDFHDQAQDASSSSSSSRSSAAVELLRQVQRAFSYLQGSQSSAFDPIQLVQASKCLNLLYPVTSQNDAGEFYDKTLDAIERAFKHEQLDYQDCFSGQSCTLKKCLNCDATSKSQLDDFSRIELMVRNESELKSSLQECLEAFVLPEVLSGDNKVDCDSCGQRSDTAFTHCISKLPSYLFILPKRFTYDLEQHQTVKLNHYIQFDKEINLYRYTESFIESGNSEAEEECWYDLTGILIHKGRAGGGHYYSFVKSGGQQQWECCNDDRVSDFDIDAKLAEECFGGTVERTTMDDWNYVRTQVVDVEKSAFMLLYSRRQQAAVVSRKRKFDEVQQDNVVALQQEVEEANRMAFQQAMLASPVTIDLYFASITSEAHAMDFYFKVVCHHCDLKQCGEWLDQIKPIVVRKEYNNTELLTKVLYDVHLPRHKRLATLFGLRALSREDLIRTVYDAFAVLYSEASSAAGKQRGLLENYLMICSNLHDLVAPPAPLGVEELLMQQQQSAVAVDNSACGVDSLLLDYLAAFSPPLIANVKLQVLVLEHLDLAPVFDYVKLQFASFLEEEEAEAFLDKLVLGALMESHQANTPGVMVFEPTAKILLLRDLVNSSCPKRFSHVINAVCQAVFSPRIEDAMQKGPFKLVLPPQTVWEERLFPVDFSQTRFAVRIVSAFADFPHQQPEVDVQWVKLCEWFLIVSSAYNQLAHVNAMDCDYIATLRAKLAVASHDGGLVSKWCGNSAEEVAFSVERAGDRTINGLYKLKPPMIADNPRWYCEENGLSLYKCALSTGADEWFISKLLPGVSHSDAKTIDYYSCSISNSNSTAVVQPCMCQVPNPYEWMVRGKQGAYPAPLVRKVVLCGLQEHEEEDSLSSSAGNVATTPQSEDENQFQVV